MIGLLCRGLRDLRQTSAFLDVPTADRAVGVIAGTAVLLKLVTTARAGPETSRFSPYPSAFWRAQSCPGFLQISPWQMIEWAKWLTRIGTHR